MSDSGILALVWRKKDVTNLGHFWIRRKAPKRQPLHFILGWYKRPGNLAFDGLLPHDLKRTQASACDRPIFFCISWTDCRIKMIKIYKVINFNDRAVWRKKGDGVNSLGMR